MPPRGRPRGSRNRRRYVRKAAGYGWRKRPMRAYSSKFSLVKGLNNHGFHYWKEKCHKSITVQVDANGNFSSAFTFQPKDLLNFWDPSLNPPLGGPGAMSSIFDYYQVRGVQVKFFPLSNIMSAGGPNLQYINTLIAYKPDYDDVQPFPTFANACEADATVRQFNKPIKVYLKPRLRNLVQDTTPTTTATSFNTGGTNRWLDMRNVDVPQYGLKYIIQSPAIPPGNVVGGVTMQVVMTYYIAMKGQL